MLKFLFGKMKGEEAIVQETQRQAFERLVAELNQSIDELPEKPKVTFDPASGNLAFELPEQFPDEALALPAPETAPPAVAEDAKIETPEASNDEPAKPQAA